MELEGEINQDIPKVKFYDGKEGLKNILNERLNINAKDVRLFSSLGTVKNLFSHDEILLYRKERALKGVYYKGIYNYSNKLDFVTPEMAERKLIPQTKFPFYSDIAVYKDKVSICSLKDPVWGVILESQAVADTFRSIFELAYEGAEKYDVQNKDHNKTDE